MKRLVRILIVAAGILVNSQVGATPVPVATWEFNNTLAANEPSAPALTAINPLGKNSFIRDNVFGTPRIVYRYEGNKTPSEQAGLLVSTKGLLKDGDAYSVEMIFQFESSQSTWKSIFGISNRQSDNAFYVEPGNKLQVYPNHGGPTDFTFGQYHHVTLTNDGRGHVTSYLDGIFQFDLKTDIVSFASYTGVNPERLIHFFVDNMVGGGQGEYVNGRVALIRIYASELAKVEVNKLGAPPSKENLVLMPVRGTDWVAADTFDCNDATQKNGRKPGSDMTFEEYKKKEYKDFDAFKRGEPSSKEIEQRKAAEAKAESIKAENKRLKAALKAVITEGLKQQYQVFSSEQDCADMDCLKSAAEANKAKLAAVPTISRQEGGYALKLSIQNLEESSVVYAKSATAAQCGANQFEAKFRELSRLPAQ